MNIDKILLEMDEAKVMNMAVDMGGFEELGEKLGIVGGGIKEAICEVAPDVEWVFKRRAAVEGMIMAIKDRDVDLLMENRRKLLEALDRLNRKEGKMDFRGMELL